MKGVYSCDWDGEACRDKFVVTPNLKSKGDGGDDLAEVAHKSGCPAEKSSLLATGFIFIMGFWSWWN